MTSIHWKFLTNFAKVPAAAEEVFQIFRSQLQSGIRNDTGVVYPFQDPPATPGIYRLTVYFSGGTGTGTGYWSESLTGTDISGATLSGSGNLNVFCNEVNWQWTPPITISLKPEVPLTYQVQDIAASNCQYNVVIVVEQLL